MFPIQSTSCFLQRMLGHLLAGVLLLYALAPVSAQENAPPNEKRAMKVAGPADVAPVTIGPVEYRVIHFGRAEGLDQNGGYIAAHDKKSGEKLWTLKIYSTAIDPQLERDVQDVFITGMRKRGKQLAITDQEGRRYWVDVAKRSVKAR
jgi:hypothetical protein